MMVVFDDEQCDTSRVGVTIVVKQKRASQSNKRGQQIMNVKTIEARKNRDMSDDRVYIYIYIEEEQIEMPAVVVVIVIGQLSLLCLPACPS